VGAPGLQAPPHRIAQLLSTWRSEFGQARPGCCAAAVPEEPGPAEPGPGESPEGRLFCLTFAPVLLRCPAMRTYEGKRTHDGAHVTRHQQGHEPQPEQEQGQRARRFVLPLPLCLDLWGHSPTGFGWGYGGSGPAQLSLALLADALGDDEKAVRLHQPQVGGRRPPARPRELDPHRRADWGPLTKPIFSVS